MIDRPSSGIDTEQVHHHKSRLFARVNAQLLVHGNVDERVCSHITAHTSQLTMVLDQKTLEFLRTLNETILCRSTTPGELLPERTLQLPRGTMKSDFMLGVLNYAFRDQSRLRARNMPDN